MTDLIGSPSQQQIDLSATHINSNGNASNLQILQEKIKVDPSLVNDPVFMQQLIMAYTATSSTKFSPADYNHGPSQSNSLPSPTPVVNSTPSKLIPPITLNAVREEASERSVSEEEPMELSDDQEENKMEERKMPNTKILEAVESNHTTGSRKSAEDAKEEEKEGQDEEEQLEIEDEELKRTRELARQAIVQLKHTVQMSLAGKELETKLASLENALEIGQDDKTEDEEEEEEEEEEEKEKEEEVEQEQDQVVDVTPTSDSQAKSEHENENEKDKDKEGKDKKDANRDSEIKVEIRPEIENKKDKQEEENIKPVNKINGATIHEPQSKQEPETVSSPKEIFAIQSRVDSNKLEIDNEPIDSAKQQYDYDTSWLTDESDTALNIVVLSPLKKLRRRFVKMLMSPEQIKQSKTTMSAQRYERNLSCGSKDFVLRVLEMQEFTFLPDLFDNDNAHLIVMVFSFDTAEVSEREYKFMEELTQWMENSGHWPSLWKRSLRVLDYALSDNKDKKNNGIESVNDYCIYLKERTDDLDRMFEENGAIFFENYILNFFFFKNKKKGGPIIKQSKQKGEKKKNDIDGPFYRSKERDKDKIGGLN
ncbi:hypothetical protein RFI_39182 [Reticulomyxa filosa]|uniref:Uncharacterized protein n=1 Tax=Reticulomyxa filosa TaxID=46433 RepID=X6L8K8_RETFI|nr:hypothetical protein RFI_39182 [Reticulomyxa filosa]|eukprot:ETN98332.1 hypothetical protein RFI_39182 [Reticulomyxa filosa]